MPQMTSPKQLFEHELQDVYYAEKAIEKMLPKLAREATTPDLSEAFEHHLKETKGHIANLERVFAEIGKPATGTPCPGIEGIKTEHDEFMKEEDASASIRDIFLTGAAARTEHYEIAAYTGLISKAKTLGEKEVAELLDKNLRQEKAALKKVEMISRQVLRESSKKPGTKRTSRKRVAA